MRTLSSVATCLCVIEPSAYCVEPQRTVRWRFCGTWVTLMQQSLIWETRQWGFIVVQLEGGIRGFKDVRPAVVLVSSSAVERNAAIGDDAEARKRDIPIVQLNPGGILNFKYMGETALRASGLPYSVIRPVGEPR